MNCLCSRDNLSLSFSLSVCLWADCSYGDHQSLLQAHLIFCLGWLLTVEIHRMLARSHLLWRQQILAAEQLPVPAGIRLDTAVVVGQEFTYKQISLFEPCVTILTNCECTEMCLLNSEDAAEAQICTVQSPGGSQLSASLLLSALDSLYAIPIPPHIALPACPVTYRKNRCLLHALLWALYWKNHSFLLISGAAALKYLLVTSRTCRGRWCIIRLCLMWLHFAVWLGCCKEPDV